MEVPPNYCNPMMTRRAKVVKGGGRRSKYQRPGMEEPLVGLEVEDRKKDDGDWSHHWRGTFTKESVSLFLCAGDWPGSTWSQFLAGRMGKEFVGGVQSSLANDKEALVFIFAWGSGVGGGASERRVREQCAICMAG